MPPRRGLSPQGPVLGGGEVGPGAPQRLGQPIEPNYFTRIQTEKETEILEIMETRQVAAFTARIGRLKVTEHIMSYEKRRLPGQELLGMVDLELPPQIFETVGMWLEIPDAVKNAIYASGGHFMGGIHALEHVLIGMFPLFALADRYDIGGISHPAHPQVGRAAIFIYDGYPGGVGLSVRAYDILEELLQRSREVTAACPCEDGCPSCIHSPKCGSGNKPLDKEATVAIAGMLLGLEEPEGDDVSYIEAAIAPALAVDEPVTGGTWLTQRKIGVLDLETRCSAADVGGWGQCHLMGVSLAVLHETHTGVATTYREHDLERLGHRLTKLDLVVGFNIKRFDYRVLQPYTKARLAELPTLDILEEVYTTLGTRLSLNHLAEKTLERRRAATASWPWNSSPQASGRSWTLTAARTWSLPIGSSSSGPNMVTSSTSIARAAWCGSGGLARRAVLREIKQSHAKAQRRKFN